MQTYLFYDIETTGLNKAFDQVLQFAAIRTDLNLNEIDRHEIIVKLNPDMIPSPGAMLTHRIGIEESQTGINEYTAMQQIHQLLNEPGTISLGYNTLGFDDEFLRFAFYRNLLTPYTHQYANQCMRMDIYPMTIMYHLFKNEILEWPKIDGDTKLKLELINSTNRLVVGGRAHNAMVDVEVTLALAKRFFQVKEMWDYVLGYYSRQTDIDRAGQLQPGLKSSYGNHHEGLMVLGKIGAGNFFHAPVLSLGNHDVYKHQTSWLRLDTENLTLTTEESIPDTTWAIRKKWGENGFILPLKERFLVHLGSDRKALAAGNKQWLQDNPDIFHKIIAYHRAFIFPVLPATDVEAALYQNGFWSDEEMALCRRFHHVIPAQKAQLTAQMKNKNLKALAVRLLARNFPEVMTPEQREEFAAFTQRLNAAEASEPVIDFRGNKRMNAHLALADLANWEQHELVEEQKELLMRLKEYLLARV
jgi:exodeoxyribonuclease-1